MLSALCRHRAKALSSSYWHPLLGTIAWQEDNSSPLVAMPYAGKGHSMGVSVALLSATLALGGFQSAGLGSNHQVSLLWSICLVLQVVHFVYVVLSAIVSGNKHTSVSQLSLQCVSVDFRTSRRAGRASCLASPTPAPPSSALAASSAQVPSCLPVCLPSSVQAFRFHLSELLPVACLQAPASLTAQPEHWAPCSLLGLRKGPARTSPHAGTVH